jgi:hypothetical protein
MCAGLCQKSMRPKPKPVASTNLEGSLLRELEPLLGRQPTSAHIRQTIERLSYHPSTGQLSITLRDGTGFAYLVPAAQGRTSRKPRPAELQRVPALSRVLALAITCQKLMEEGTVASYEELARLTGLSRSRLSQILLLANLAPAIQEQLLFLSKLGSAPDRLFVKDIRHILRVLDWRQQAALFQSVWSQAARQS